MKFKLLLLLGWTASMSFAGPLGRNALIDSGREVAKATIPSIGVLEQRLNATRFFEFSKEFAVPLAGQEYTIFTMVKIVHCFVIEHYDYKVFTKEAENLKEETLADYKRWFLEILLRDTPKYLDQALVLVKAYNTRK